MRHKILLASIAIALAGCKTDKSALVGIYSNGMSEFRASSVFLSSSGYGIFAAGVGGVPGSWDVIQEGGNCYVHMHWADWRSSEVHEGDVLFAFNKKQRTLEFVGKGDNLESALANAHALPADRPFNREENYHFVTNSIPQEYEKMLADFPANLEKKKREAENWKRQKEAEAARAKREQPIYGLCWQVFASPWIFNSRSCVGLERASEAIRTYFDKGILGIQDFCEWEMAEEYDEHSGIVTFHISRELRRDLLRAMRKGDRIAEQTLRDAGVKDSGAMDEQEVRVPYGPYRKMLSALRGALDDIKPREEYRRLQLYLALRGDELAQNNLGNIYRKSK